MPLAKQRTALIVSPYFVPSNLAGVHRNRLLAANLARAGWRAIVVTIDPADYEGSLDPGMAHLLPQDVEVVHAGAMPARWCRAFGIGDLSLRGYWGLRRELERLLSARNGDLVFVSILPGYSSLLGAWAKRKWGIPFVLDYQDPWVSRWGAAQPRVSKAGLAHALAGFLEHRVVPRADAVTAVSQGTLDGLRERGVLRADVPVEIVPIGAEPRDHEVAAREGRSAISRSAGATQLAYLGTVNEDMLEATEAILAALARAESNVVLSLIGTSGREDGADTLGLASLAQRHGVAARVRIVPQRIGYLDALRTMADADALLLIGSRYGHYTASKVFPYWLAGKPIVGLVHEASSVLGILRELGGAKVIAYGDAGPSGHAAELARVIDDVASNGPRNMAPRNDAAFVPYSAAAVAGRYARLFDRLVGARPA